MKDQAEEQSTEVEVPEQPEKDSEVVETPEQPETDSENRYGFIDETKKELEKPDEAESKDDVKKDEKLAKPEEEPEVEEKKEEQEEDSKPVFEYEDGKVTIKKGEEKQELIEVEIDGKKGLVSSEFKDGFLRTKDYTQKTQKLSEEKKLVEEKEAALKEREYMLYLGKEPKKPQEPDLDDYIDSKGKYFSKYDTDEEAKDAYKQAVKDYNEGTSPEMQQYQKFVDDKTKLDKVKSEAQEKTLEMIESFKEKYGEEEAEAVISEAQKYINPYVVEGLQPYPEDALEIVRKGMKYDEDLKALKDEIETKVKEGVAAKMKALKETKPVAKATQPQDTPVNKNIPDRYGFIQQN